MSGKSKSRGNTSHGSSSKKSAQSATTQPSTSFLFAVNELPLNEDPGQGGIAPRVNEHGRYLPPLSSAGFWPPIPGRMFRWTDGVITLANNYQWYNGGGWGPNNIPLVSYRTTSMFWSNDWTQFLTADGDVTRSDIATAQFPFNRWYCLSFNHAGTISNLGTHYENLYLAGSIADWIGPLGLSSHINRQSNERTSLAGNLATVIGLIAFSCQASELENVLLNDRAWRRREWRGHNRAHGRDEGRGILVSTYLDPGNTQGSTMATLSPLERDPLLR